MYVYVHVYAWVQAGESLSANSVGGFLMQVCSQAFMRVCVCVCVLKQVDRCEG